MAGCLAAVAVAGRPEPQLGGKVVVLGLGAGTLATFIVKFMGMMVTAVELDPVVVGIARSHFELEESERLRVVEGDGLEYVDWLADVGKGEEGGREG